MIRTATTLALAMLLFSAKLASADFYDDCVQDCAKAQTQCVEEITLYDATGISEAKQACADGYRDCKAKCHVDDAKANDDAAEQQRAREAEEAERKRQEEQNSGGIKTYKFEN